MTHWKTELVEGLADRKKCAHCRHYKDRDQFPTQLVPTFTLHGRVSQTFWICFECIWGGTSHIGY